jgi:hypothetical protein
MALTRLECPIESVSSRDRVEIGIWIDCASPSGLQRCCTLTYEVIESKKVERTDIIVTNEVKKEKTSLIASKNYQKILKSEFHDSLKNFLEISIKTKFTKMSSIYDVTQFWTFLTPLAPWSRSP